MARPPSIVLSEPIDEDVSRWLRRHARVLVAREGAIGPTLADADGLLVRTYTRVDGKLLDHGPRLRVIGRAGTGLDTIDLAECRKHGVEVVYTPEANTQAVVEYVLLLLVTALRPRVTLSEVVSPGEWNALRARCVGRRQMSELTLGLLGLGRIGRRVAEVAGTIGFDVIYSDLLDIPPEARAGAAPVDAQTLFTRSDILSLHVDGRPSNRHFVGAALLDRMKPDAMLINTSRGFVVDNVALAAFLRRHPDARAVLDVHEPEPFDERYPLLGVSNASLSPHLASRTATALRNMSWVVRDMIAVLRGDPPRFPAPHRLPD